MIEFTMAELQIIIDTLQKTLNLVGANMYDVEYRKAVLSKLINADFKFTIKQKDV